MNTKYRIGLSFFLLVALFLSAFTSTPAPLPQSDNADPPEQIVKLVFIHHSTGENWLTDGYGNLGRTLGENNYFVSDTNYGWGPEAIGDRTDIPNWVEWFASENTPTYTSALFNENGQHSSYTRALSDPGGENEIIMFKSCFPNSELAGSPTDAAGTYEELSVAGAKYVYNEILKYFATRPDKLFVVITAPPLSDGTYAANARAFNTWLLNDWLRENGYALNNVAVFDFYNILTSPDAHHRYNGGVEYIAAGSNTLHYPSGDDHPSAQGSQKATEEFIPLLNVFYHRWKAGAPTQPPPAEIPSAQSESAPEASAPSSPALVSLLDDFESDSRLWEPFSGETADTTMKCSAQTGPTRSGSRALLIEYSIAPAGWGTCAHFPESIQDWGASKGLTFYVHAAQAGVVFDIDLYAGSRDAQETYLYTVNAPAECASGYAPVTILWSDFTRASWEDNAGAIFDKPNQIVGIAFGIGSSDVLNAGSFWVDDLSLTDSSAPAPEATQPAQESESAPQEQKARPPFSCAGALLPLSLLVGLMFWRKR